jgi:hypothetical protein
MREQVDQVEVLQEKRAGGAYSLRGIGVEDGSAVGGGVDRRVREFGVAHDCAESKRLVAEISDGKEEQKKKGDV